MTTYVLIIFVAFSGFILSVYLRHKKNRKEHFVCPLRAKCSSVIQSRYSKFFGIPVEIIGMVYYALIAIGYGVASAMGHLDGLGYLLLAATTGAFLFSVYLTFIQIFALREYCSWCLLSASFCTIIFILALAGSMEEVVPFLQANKQTIIILHAIAAAVGLGGATIGDVFFFKFLKDFRISLFESNILRIVSEVIWMALGLIVMTGLGLFLSDMEFYAASSKFLTKMTIVLIIAVNGALLNLLVAPRLIEISFGKEHKHRSGELARLRNLAFALGPISFLSWYTAFVLGMMRSVPLSYPWMLALFVTALIIAVSVGEFLQGFLHAKADEVKE